MFYNLLTAPRTVSNTYAQVARAQLCANHVQHIERLSRASVMLRATLYHGPVVKTPASGEGGRGLAPRPDYSNDLTMPVLVVALPDTWGYGGRC